MVWKWLLRVYAWLNRELHERIGEKPANLAQASDPRLSESSKVLPLDFSSSCRLGDLLYFLARRCRLSENSHDQELAWNLAVATIELSPRREGVAWAKGTLSPGRESLIGAVVLANVALSLCKFFSLLVVCGYAWHLCLNGLEWNYYYEISYDFVGLNIGMHV